MIVFMVLKKSKIFSFIWLDIHKYRIVLNKSGMIINRWKYEWTEKLDFEIPSLLNSNHSHIPIVIVTAIQSANQPTISQHIL